MFDSLDMIYITYWSVLHLWVTKLLQSQADNIKNFQIIIKSTCLSDIWLPVESNKKVYWRKRGFALYREKLPLDADEPGIDIYPFASGFLWPFAWNFIHVCLLSLSIQKT